MIWCRWCAVWCGVLVWCYLVASIESMNFLYKRWSSLYLLCVLVFKCCQNHTLFSRIIAEFNLDSSRSSILSEVIQWNYTGVSKAILWRRITAANCPPSPSLLRGNTTVVWSVMIVVGTAMDVYRERLLHHPTFLSRRQQTSARPPSAPPSFPPFPLCRNVLFTIYHMLNTHHPPTHPFLQ